MSTSPPSSTRARVMPWVKRGVIGMLMLANVAVFYVYWQLRSIEQTVQETAQTVKDVVPQLSPTQPGSTAPITFLLVGSDSRANLASTEGFGVAAGQRSDVIMLIKVYPDQDRAQILSLPRDLWVDIPGHDTQKINAAYALGGAPLLIQTVKAVTDIEINHYIEIDFVGFEAIVDQLGGVTIDFPYPARDRKSHLDVAAGPQLLNGEQALAFARSRSYQELRDGKWVSVDANDFGRQSRQQQLILAILDQIRRPSSLTETAAIVGSFTQHVGIDESLADSSLIELAFRMRGLRGGSIETATFPGVTDTVGSASVVRPKEPEASAVLEAFRNGTSMDIQGANRPTSVRILNGNGVSGNAGQWSDFLKSAGFEVPAVGDADRKDYEGTQILVKAGDEERGNQVLASLGFGTVELGSVPSDVDVVVILGADAASVAAAG